MDWRRRLVDPTHGGGKFGHRGIGGEELLLAALPGMGYRGALRNLWARNARANRSRIPSFPSPNGGTVFRGQRFGRDATLNDLRTNYMRPPGAVRPAGPATIQRDRILPRVVSGALRPRLGPHRRVDHSLKGVRPYRNPSGGIGLYKGTRTGTQQPLKEPNPFQRAAQWWRFNNPWM